MRDIVICMNSWPPLKWLMEQKNPFTVCKHAVRYNEFGYKLNKRCILTSSNFNTLILSHSISSSKDYQSSRKEKESSCIVFSPSTKGHFHVIVMQSWQRNVQKSITHMQSSSVVKPISFSRPPPGFPVEKMNVYEHWTLVTFFNPLRASKQW